MEEEQRVQHHHHHHHHQQHLLQRPPPPPPTLVHHQLLPTTQMFPVQAPPPPPPPQTTTAGVANISRSVSSAEMLQTLYNIELLKLALTSTGQGNLASYQAVLDYQFHQQQLIAAAATATANPNNHQPSAFLQKQAAFNFINNNLVQHPQPLLLGAVNNHHLVSNDPAYLSFITDPSFYAARNLLQFKSREFFFLLNNKDSLHPYIK